jgi:hypothetical protein
MIVTLVFGIRFLIWYITNWSRLSGSVDPFSALEEMWVQVRWPLAGIALFAAGWLWALITSLQLLRSAKDTSPAPPRLP